MFGSLSHQGSSRVLPPAIMAVSGLSLYVGAALAVGLFDHFPPVVVAWFRIATAGLILWAFFRPRASSFIGRPALIATFFGVAAMAMNMTFYGHSVHPAGFGRGDRVHRAGDRCGLGVEAAARLLSSVRHRWRAGDSAQWSLRPASCGRWQRACSGLYPAWCQDFLNADTSKASLAVGFTYAGVLGFPLRSGYGQRISHGCPDIIGLAAGLGLLSAAIPYSLDQVVLRLAGSSLFALLQAVLPLVATLVGAVALKQWISLTELAGIALVILAIVLRKP